MGEVFMYGTRVQKARVREAMLESLIDHSDVAFHTAEDVRERLRQACEANADIAAFHEIGTSEEGRPIDAVVMGTGSLTVSLLGGLHADEPVGAESLRAFVLGGLAQRRAMEEYLATYRFVVVPQCNPDGEKRNQRWIEQWPDLAGFARHVAREGPGRDMEFGFPDMRRENRAIAGFLRSYAPFCLHMSLHGMALSEGAMLLIERHWIDRSTTLRERFAGAVAAAGLSLHDHNRKGEKGFIYIAPGFTTTPEGRSMRAYFRAVGDQEAEASFHDSSMEFVRSLNGDPLCLVTELPLFVVKKHIENRPEGVPVAYVEARKKMEMLRAENASDEAFRAFVHEFDIVPLGLEPAMRLHFMALQLGLETVVAGLSGGDGAATS